MSLDEMAGKDGSSSDSVLHLKLADPQEATYWGRVRKTFDMLDFRMALVTDEQVQSAVRLIAAKSMLHKTSHLRPHLTHAIHVR
jgi:uncharacterized protein YllA (UPF0747 family)